MKTTIVPAQITSVEDKIAGNISVKQVLLLMTPIFLGVAIFALLPPFTKYTNLKLAIVLVMAVICGILAVRWRGKLVAEWISILTRYNARPRYYVFSKKELYLRPKNEPIVNFEPKNEGREPEFVKQPLPQFKLSPAESIHLEGLIENPDSDFHFTVSKKGGLHVHVKKVNETA